MKKVLIGILIILLVVMAYFAIFRGISIGNFEILSLKQIESKNDNLTQEIASTEALMHRDYSAKTEELEKSVSDLLAAKEEYKDLENVSTQSEIKKATRQETYKIEYLWTKIGSYATAEGVTLKLDILAGETGEPDVKNLSFTVSGNYGAIIQFITRIEDDTQLGFRIENFKMLPGSSETGREATFVVRNIRIKQETTSNVTTNNSTNVQSEANADNTNNVGTENTTNTNNADTQNTTQE